MAKYRSKIKANVKKGLLDESGGKCANPGCSNRLTQIHHIDEWHVYRSHRPAAMICICASCHDNVHRGALNISDATLYRWKGIDRKSKPRREQVYVEPGESPKLQLGSIAFTGQSGVTVLGLSNRNSIGFTLRGGELYFVNATVGIGTRTFVKIVENQVVIEPNPSMDYASVPGHLIARIPLADVELPTWVLDAARWYVPTFAQDEHVTLLDVEVCEPGLVRVQGIWLARDECFIATETLLIWAKPGRRVAFAGDGPSSVIKFGGPITRRVLGDALHLP